MWITSENSVLLIWLSILSYFLNQLPLDKDGALVVPEPTWFPPIVYHLRPLVMPIILGGIAHRLVTNSNYSAFDKRTRILIRLSCCSLLPLTEECTFRLGLIFLLRERFPSTNLSTLQQICSCFFGVLHLGNYLIAPISTKPKWTKYVVMALHVIATWSFSSSMMELGPQRIWNAILLHCWFNTFQFFTAPFVMSNETETLPIYVPKTEQKIIIDSLIAKRSDSIIHVSTATHVVVFPDKTGKMRRHSEPMLRTTSSAFRYPHMNLVSSKPFTDPFPSPPLSTMSLSDTLLEQTS